MNFSAQMELSRRDLFRRESACKGSKAWEMESEEAGAGLSKEEYFNNYELKSRV